MQNRTLTALAALLVLTASRGALAYEALQGPTELRLWDRARAFEGLTLFAAAGKTYLIDMTGRVVHRWDKVGTNPHLLGDGSLLDASKDDPSGFSGFQIVDWDGNVTWQYTESRQGYSPHHDFTRIFNPKLGAYTTLYVANKSVTQAEAIAAGADPAKGPYDGSQMDTIVEVDDAGSVVWEWRFFDHVVQDVDASKPNYVGAGKTIKDHPGRINLNMPGNPLKRDWLHCNSVDYNQALDQIVTNSVQGELYVIDHGATFVPGDAAASIAAAASTKGDFLYRFGDPARYGQGDPPSITANWTVATAGHKQMGGAHDVSWIPDGLPGAGHLLIFNNGQLLFEHTPQSYIYEVAPFLDSSKVDTGGYVNPPSAGYTRVMPVNTNNNDKVPKNVSNQIVWSYSSKTPTAFFSHIGGSAQRLPNGNTLVCADTDGHFFEVTSDGTLVWEYINPMTRDGGVATLGDDYPMLNSVFRAYRYAANDPAFAGRDLTPGETLTGVDPGVDAGPIVVDAGGADAGGLDGGLGDAGSGSLCPPSSADGGGGGCAVGNRLRRPEASGFALAVLVALGVVGRGRRARRGSNDSLSP